MRPRHARVARSLDLAGKRVLDVGCASGLYSLYMADSADEVIGLDHSRSNIEKADERVGLLGLSNVRFVCADVRDEGLFEELGHFDLVLVWGFLHRVTDPFTLLHQLSGVTDAFSLEWTTPVFAGMDRASLAYHREEGSALDPTNLGAPKEGEEVRDTKIQGRTSFWCPTPHAVRVILGRWGFEHFRVLGYGDDFHSQARVVARHLARRMVRRRGVSYRRVHMIVEKDLGLIRFKHRDLRDADLPAWDVAGRMYMGTAAGS